MQSLPSALAIASADHVAQAGSLVKTSSSTLVSTRMSVMTAHGIDVAVDLAEVDGRARREAVPLSYFERNGDLPFGGNASRHGRFEVLLIYFRVILRFACRFNERPRGDGARSRTRPGRSR